MSVVFSLLCPAVNSGYVSSSEFLVMLLQFTETKAVLGIHLHVPCWKSVPKQKSVRMLGVIMELTLRGSHLPRITVCTAYHSIPQHYYLT